MFKLLKLLKFLKDIRKWLAGKKVYLTSVSAIVVAVIAYSEGAMTIVELYTAVMAALLAMGFGAKLNRNSGTPA